jgi:exonuclease SbcD
MRLLHTSDWHLGHTLHGLPREHEHARFLSWLLDTLEAEGVDALLVAGDVFDTANPSAQAQAQWYGFVAEARRRLPALDIVVAAGNHDSPGRLEAPAPLFRAMGVHVVGYLPWQAGRLDEERLLAPLRASGEVVAWVAAVPFLRPADLPAVDGEGDPVIEGVRRVYGQALDAARRRRRPGQALIATGHCYLAGTAVSELSERRILGGNEHALPAELFPDDVAYAALGHLHLAQKVGGQERVRYSGSPLPLAMSEASYRHQVLVVDLDGERLARVRSVGVPRAVEVLRVPVAGALPLPEVVVLLRELPGRPDGLPEGERPYLEVCVALDRPEPALRRQVEEALEGRAPRLVKLTAVHEGDGRSLAEAAAARDLKDLNPEEVFRSRYRRSHEGDPPPELLAAFHELVDQVGQEAGE